MSEQCTGLSLYVSLYQSLVAQSKIIALIAKTTDVFDLLVRLRHFINLTSMHNKQETKGLTMLCLHLLMNNISSWESSAWYACTEIILQLKTNSYSK